MTLHRRLGVGTALLLGSLIAVVGVSLWGAKHLVSNVVTAQEEFAEMRQIDRIGVQLIKIRGALNSAKPDISEITFYVDAATHALEDFAELQETDEQSKRDQEHAEAETLAATAFIRRLHGMTDILQRHATELDSPRVRYSLIQTVEALQDDLDAVSQQIDEEVLEARMRTDENVRLMLFTMVGVVVSSAIVLILVGTWQYRHVMRPLRRLRDGVERIAAGDLQHRLSDESDEEFNALARDFNHMTSELEALYTDLDQRVKTRTRELARSERLASVGFLAAGIAHEINNPMGIISGYAELLIKQFGKDPQKEETQQTLESLAIIRDEAFRCKKITQRLLSVMQKDDAELEPVNLAEVAGEVAAMITALKTYENQSIDLQFEPADSMNVMAYRPEMKQVLLNLTINAMEAVRETGDRVWVHGRCQDDTIVLEVGDEGRGMDAQTLEQIFEPFFSRRQDPSEPGTGLGLFIVHAIVTDMSGAIDATSEGPGRGSKFTVTLPACNTEGAAV